MVESKSSAVEQPAPEHTSAELSRGEQTRERIIRKSAEVFNVKGYASASIADVMEATGLQKGGIYNHFQSKDEIALSAFEYASQLIAERLIHAIKNAEKHAIARLQAMIHAFVMYVEEPPLRGGCPVTNAAVESDYAYPELRPKVREAMDSLRGMIKHLLDEGIKRRQIKPSVNSDYVATVVIASLEGAVLLTTLYRDRVHLDRVIHFLHEYCERELAL